MEEQDPEQDAVLTALRELGSIDLEHVGFQAATHERARLTEVQSQEEDAETGVVVTLRRGDHAVTGIAHGAGGDHGLCRTAAAAALDALQQLLVERSAELHVDWIAVLDPPTPRRPSAVHVTVAFRTAAGEQLLAGSALVRQSLVDAAVRATLDAVNRYATPLLAQDEP